MLVSVGTSKLGPIGAQIILSIGINFKKELQTTGNSLNPLSPKSDQYQIYPFNINAL